MRRKDREVTDVGQIRAILDACKTCHLAMVDHGQPYVIPLNYGYSLEDGVLTLFFHSAKEGRKIDILRENASVCFEMCNEGDLLFSANPPCETVCCFASVHGFGQAQFIEDAAEKCAALSVLMKHQAQADIVFTPEQVERVCVFQVVSDNFTGKQKAH